MPRWGAEVKKGDILVSGRIEVLNDDGEIMQYLYRPSDADIKAKVLYSYRDVIDGTWVEMAPTGNTKECYSITLLDNVFDWPFFRNPFAEYQVQTESRQLHVADNFYLPVWLNKSEFTEVEQVRHERTGRGDPSDCHKEFLGLHQRFGRKRYSNYIKKCYYKKYG